VIEPGLRRAVVDANRALAAAGQSDLVWGHVALRAPDDRGVIMKASGFGFEEVGDEQIVLVDPQGRVLEGSGRRHLEFFIHTEILRARPDVHAVVHTHSEPAAAFASLDVPLRPLTHDAVPFLTPDIPRFLHSGNLIASSELGALLARELGNAAGILIPGHGMVTVGDSLPVAVMRAALLDRACRVQLQALAAGGPRRWSSDDEVAAKQAGLWTDAQLHAGYDYLVRAAARA
jgi:L-ribulose-5-phosphate 4-epimerase